jgi:hypothetical protein
MSKYDPLWQHFRGLHEPVVELSFEMIQKILGFPIDHSFLNYKKELERHGYRVHKIHLKEKRVVFEKVKEG